MKAAFTYLATGIGIGAALSILFAPRSGEETREWFASKFLDAIDAGNEQVWQSRMRIRDIMNEGQLQISRAVAAGRLSFGKHQSTECPAARESFAAVL